MISNDNIPFFSFEKRNSDIREQALRTFSDFFDSSWYVLGSFTSKFEEEYAKFNQTNYSVGVSTGLDALHLALLALGIQRGDEVIVPSNTYIATVLSITYIGAIPVFVEPRWSTCNINPDLIEEAITERTRVIMPVHLYGQVCEMDKICEIAKRYNLFIVEDNAQAHGAKFRGKLAGSFGSINATSFYPTKNIGALGEAGAITTNVQLLAEKVKTLRNYGSSTTYFNDIIGYNDRIDEFEAAFLLTSLDFFKKWTAERLEIDQLYRQQLSDIEEITLTDIAIGATTVNHLFTVRTDKRDKLQAFLKNKGIGTKIHYPVPPHLQKCYEPLGFAEGDFPIAEKISKQTLSLPNFIGLSESQIYRVGNEIKSFFSN